MQIHLLPIFAEAAGEGFSFSSFQKSFYEAWQFIIPNLVMLVLCVGTAKFVGKHEMSWLRLPWDRVRSWLQRLSQVLKDSGLFGSQFFPLVVLLAVIIACLDVFQVARLATSNLLPPFLIERHDVLYARLASDETLVRLGIREHLFSNDRSIYEPISRWADRMRSDSSVPGASNLKHWDESYSNWYVYANNLKLLAAIAIVSSIVGVFQGKWSSIPRMLAVLVALCVGYGFCLGKQLYATEQQAHSVLSSLEQGLRQDSSHELAENLLRRRWVRSPFESSWLTAERGPVSDSFWRLELIDTYFFKRLAWLFALDNERPESKRPPLFTNEELDWLKAEFASGRKDIQSGGPSDIRAPTNSTALPKMPKTEQQSK